MNYKLFKVNIKKNQNIILKLLTVYFYVG